MGEVATQQVEVACGPPGTGSAEDVMRGLGYGDGLADIDKTLRNAPRLRQAQGHRGPDTHHTRAPGLGGLLEHVVRERGNNLPAELHRLRIVAMIRRRPVPRQSAC